MTKTTYNLLISDTLEEDFNSFDLTPIQNVLSSLANEQPIDLAHADKLQQQALRGADLLSEFIGRIVKTVSYLESQANIVKNKASLNYVSPDNSKVTMEMRKWAGEVSSEAEEIQIKLARAKACKVVLEKKYELLIKSHHYYKDIASSYRRVIPYDNGN